MIGETEKFESWAVVELFGHHQVAGLVGEQQIGGQAFIRVDVPDCGEGRPAHTKYFGNGAIYAIHPCTEDLARSAAARLRRWDAPLPVSVPELEAAKQTIDRAERLQLQPAGGGYADVEHVDDDFDDEVFDDDLPL